MPASDLFECSLLQALMQLCCMGGGGGVLLMVAT